MVDAFSRAAPFAGRTDAPSGHASSSTLFSRAELVRVLAVAAATLLVAAAIFVVSRRLAGAIAAPLPAAEMLFAGALLAGLGWIGHLSDTSHRPSARHLLVSLAIVALGDLRCRGLTAGAAELIGCWLFIARRRTVGMAERPAEPPNSREEWPAAIVLDWSTNLIGHSGGLAGTRRTGCRRDAATHAARLRTGAKNFPAGSACPWPRGNARARCTSHSVHLSIAPERPCGSRGRPGLPHQDGRYASLRRTIGDQARYAGGREGERAIVVLCRERIEVVGVPYVLRRTSSNWIWCSRR